MTAHIRPHHAAIVVAIASTIAVAACAPTGKRPDAAPAPVEQAATPTGDACVALSAIREAKVIDDTTIDFHMRDGRVLRNSLPAACPSLGFERAFTYSTSLNQLCSTDIIRVITQGGGPRLGASCGLGRFVPATPAAATTRE